MASKGTKTKKRRRAARGTGRTKTRRKTAHRTGRRAKAVRGVRRTTRRRKRPAWVSLPDEELLDKRLSSLRLRIEGTVLERRVAQVYRELERRGITFRPHFWLSSEWFTPDGVPGAAIAFYLAHPRLKRLEEKQMLEAEGGTHRWCMQILRHEVGHAICNAYRLNRRRKWQQLFGKSSRRYPDHYQPKPYSKRFVLHLDYWYAQSHPSEDFAETFAVWLTPGSQWRTRYTGWAALRKLRYVDELMREIGGTRPPNRQRTRIDPLPQIRMTLREHYRQKRARYGAEYPEFYDRDLRRLFVDARGHADHEPAPRFLRRVGPELRHLVAQWTGQSEYTIDLVLKEMIARSRDLRLRVPRTRARARLGVAVLLAVQTMNYLHSGYFRVVI